MIKRIKVFISMITFIVIFLFILNMFVVRIPSGSVGVVYSVSGGVQEDVLTQGWKIISPLEKVKIFPISQQQLVLSNSPSDYNEEEHQDWSIDAPADGGMVKLNMTVNYNFIAEKTPELYSKFNGMDGESIVENRVQNSIIAYVKEVTPKFSVMDIYSTKRAEVSEEITKYLNDKLLEEYGINISSALIIDVQLDETLMAKIQAKESAKQDAEKAELDKQTAIAQAETNKVKAEGDANVKIIEAEAEAKANKIISESITTELIQMKEMEARLQHGWITVQGANTVVSK